MRCLYCGKELALLKRWTSGGEFCSDAHRQQYQEEYTQLALNRLLQAKPQAKPQTELKSPPKPVEAQPALPEGRTPRALEAPKPVEKTVERTLEPTREPAQRPIDATPIDVKPIDAKPIDAKPVGVQPAEGELSPAEAGFLVELPLPVLLAVAVKAAPEADFERQDVPWLPGFSAQPDSQRWATELVAAGQIALTPSLRVADYAMHVSEARLEQRDSVRIAPLLEFDLRAVGAAGIAEKSEDPMDLLIFPQPPPDWPALWQEGERIFLFETEPGPWARMVFETTGIPDNDSGEPPVEPAAATPSEAAAASQPITQRKRWTVPDAATKPLPVTLHGLAAGRGKPVQVFPSAVSNGVDMKMPRSISLPLRPVMLLAEAPVEARAEVRVRQTVATERSAPAKRPPSSESRSSNGKGPEKEKPEMTAKAAVATAVKEPEPVPVEPPKVIPAARPYSPPDLDLPSLTLDTGGGFWTKLPLAGKAGVGLAAALAIAATVFAVTHGANPKAVTAAPQIVEGPALAAVDSGWITDWGAEPGVRREHEISVLKPSLNLSDYRLEFEAQIDSKALGWIYRATDEKNYYVNKLEIVKPGLNPTIALVRFAVIGGQEQPRMQLPLSLAVHLDTLYKIRFDAVGDRFTTYVQDQKVDEWTDDRLKMGGIGLYNERGERMSLSGTVNIVPLVIRK